MEKTTKKRKTQKTKQKILDTLEQPRYVALMIDEIGQVKVSQPRDLDEKNEKEKLNTYASILKAIATLMVSENGKQFLQDIAQKYNDYVTAAQQ